MEATVDIPTGMMTVEDAAEALGVSVEYLNDLRQKGIVSEQEFQQKKAELLEKM